MELKSQFLASKNNLLILSGLFGLSLVLSLISQKAIFSYLATLLVCLVSTSLMPSRFLLQSFSLSFTLLIGLSPIYLIARGVVTDTPTSKFDLHIYLLLFLLFQFAFKVRKHYLSAAYLTRINSKNLIGLIASLTGLFWIVTLEIYLFSKSIGDGVAWISSGDSKNHFVNAVQLIDYGFLDPRTFLTQPVSAPTFLSLLISEVDLAGLSNSQILMAQIQIYAHFWVMLIGFLGVAFAATAEFIWREIQNTEKNLPASLAALASVIPLVSLIIGPATYDGFFTALFGIITICSMTIWFFESHKITKFSYNYAFLGLMIFLSSLMAWMFVVPFTGLLFIFGLRNLLHGSAKNSKFFDFGIVTIIGIFGLALHFSDFGQNLIYQAKLALSTSGAVNVSNPNLFIGILCILILIILSLEKNNLQLKKALFVFVLCQIAALLGFKWFSNLGIFSWNYYLLKYQWIMVASQIAVLFALFLRNTNPSLKIKKLKSTLVPVILLITFFTFSESLTPNGKMWQRVLNGWMNPSASMMNKVFEQQIDYKNPTMFFRYGYEGNSMLGNFWINAFADPTEPIKGWNYTIKTDGEAAQLCEVNAYYPALTIITADLNLEKELSTICPEEKFTIKIQEPLW